jgi:ketosteroid isomerase-like protein
MRNLRSKTVNLCGSLFILVISLGFITNKKSMSINKQTVTAYMEAFRASDHPKILSCLTEDVIWDMPGVYHHSGKAAFDKEIGNDAFIGKPTITVTRLVEEADVVVAEGAVQAKKKDGGQLNAVFCDVFVMEKGKIKKLTSYLMSKN